MAKHQKQTNRVPQLLITLLEHAKTEEQKMLNPFAKSGQLKIASALTLIIAIGLALTGHHTLPGILLGITGILFAQSVEFKLYEMEILK